MSRRAIPIMANTNYFMGDLGTDTITIAVGPEESRVTLTAHESLVRRRSHYFDAAMNGNWQTAKDRLDTRPHDDPDIFRLWIQSLYTGHVNEPFDEECQPERYITLGIIFALCCELLDVVGRNQIVTAIYNKAKLHIIPFGKRFCPEFGTMVDLVYESTSEGALARKLLVDIYVHYGLEYWRWDESRTIAASLPAQEKEFYKDLVPELMKKITMPSHGSFELMWYLETISTEKSPEDLCVAGEGFTLKG